MSEQDQSSAAPAADSVVAGTPNTDTPPEAVLFRKIAEVMGEVDRIPKRGRNDFHHYDYVLEADLVDAVRTRLAARNVAVIPSCNAIRERPYETEKGRHSVVTTADLTFTFVCGDTGAMFRAKWSGQGEDPADKGLYAAYTGALKYFLMKTFLIPTGDDPESRTETDQRAQGRKASPTDGKPSDKQLSYLRSLVTKARPSEAQIAVLLKKVGSSADPKGKWTLELNRDQASDLIETFKSGLLPDPDHPSDIPAEQSEFQVGTDPDGTPF